MRKDGVPGETTREMFQKQKEREKKNGPGPGPEIEKEKMYKNTTKGGIKLTTWKETKGGNNGKRKVTHPLKEKRSVISLGGSGLLGRRSGAKAKQKFEKGHILRRTDH